MKEEKETKEKIQQSIQRGRERPMLLDDYASASKNENVNKLQVIRRFLQVLIDSGLSQREAEKHLKPEEKEMLEEAKYMEARKKEYGRK